MAGIPKVKVTFDADLAGLKQGTKQAEAELSNFDKGLAKFSAAAKAAFAAAAAAAAAYAIKIGVDGVKAAIEDEQAQARLAQTLKAATGATNEQIAATEKYISKMQIATGVADTDLRSALGRLSLSTNDLKKSQELLSLALDISKARGLSLESVSNALGKAYDGQMTSLGRLGIGLSAAELKGKSFTEVQKRLSDLFGGAAAANANTFQGKIDIMRQRFAEFQESVGNAVIPILLKLFAMIDEKLIPAFQWVKKTAIDPVTEAIMRNKDTFKALGELFENYIIPIFASKFAAAIKLVGVLLPPIIDIVAKVADAILVVVNGAIAGINVLIKAYNAIPFLPNAPTLGTVSAPKISVPKVSTSAITGTSPTIALPSVPTVTTPTVSGSGTTPSGGVKVGAVAASGLSIPSALFATGERDAVTSFNRSMFATGERDSVGATYNINVSGAIDAEGTARTIVNTLNSSFYRGTGGAEGLVYVT